MNLNQYLQFLDLTFGKSDQPYLLLNEEGKPVYSNGAFRTEFLKGENENFNFFLFFELQMNTVSAWLQTKNRIESESWDNDRLYHPDKKRVYSSSVEFVQIANQPFALVQIFRIADNKLSFFRIDGVFKKILDLIPDTIFVKDIDGQFLFGNKQLAALLGCSSDYLIGRTDFDFFPKRLAKKYQHDEQYLISSDVSILNIEEEVINYEGDEVWYLTSKVPLHDEHNQVVGLLGIGKDITNRKIEQKALLEAKRQAEIADQLKSAFVANMSHELRTPLNGILGFAQFLKQENISEEKRKQYIEVIYNNGKHLLHIINNVIELSKIDAGEVFLDKQTFDVNLLLQQIEQQILFNWQHKTGCELKLELHLFTSSNFPVYTDKNRLEQILINLLSNALKFTNEGMVKFGYQLGASDELLFYVTDTGIGIPKEKTEVIFERFRQADDSLTRNYGGVGLGLTISEGLVSLLGGKIWHQSKMDAGTSFFFTIPHIRKKN